MKGYKGQEIYAVFYETADSGICIASKLLFRSQAQTLLY